MTSFGFFAGPFILPTLAAMLILWAGFWGAYKRRPCLLSFYFWINVVFYIVSFLAGIAMIVFMSTASFPEYDSSSSFESSASSASNSVSSSSSSSSEAHRHPTFHPVQHMTNYVRSFVAPSTPITNSTNSNSDSFSIETGSGEAFDGLFVSMMVIMVISFVVSALVMFFKFYSLVLAYKMRRLLLTSSSAKSCASSTCATKIHANPTYPAYHSVAQEEAAVPAPAPVSPSEEVAVPSQHVMMYMPYPFQHGQQQAMPVVMNHNGQPVYYTYQPMTYPQFQAPAEK